MHYTIQHIAAILRAGSSTADIDFPIQFLLTDSRRLVVPAETLFFALPGDRRDGHDYIPELMKRGVRAAVVYSDYVIPPELTGKVFLRVPDVLQALQQLAAYHRRQFSIPVIGITGSNGKTIVKEWLYQLLQNDEVIVRSPRSYNSQVGVPLSVWLMQEKHTLGIFEAGISTTGEMNQLAEIIEPTLGIFTNLSDAHSEGFENRMAKGWEKMKLFKNAGAIVYAADETGDIFKETTGNSVTAPPILYSWSRHRDATVKVVREEKKTGYTNITARFRELEVNITLPFTDFPSINNALTCWLTLVILGVSPEEASKRLQRLEPIDMRLQLKKAVNNCTLLNDSYSNDETSLALAIDYQMQQAGGQSTILILSDLMTAEVAEDELYPRLARMIHSKGIKKLIGIGPRLTRQNAVFQELLPSALFFPDTDAFFRHFLLSDFQSSVILIKGARVFQLEKIAHWLELVTHQTQLSIDLGALSRNIRKHQTLLRNETQLMIVLKAFGYGSGSTEIARMLQYRQVHYLAVAYVDEGIQLRQSGIRLPIMVMNAEESAWEAMLQYQLEPEIFSSEMMEKFLHYLGKMGMSSYPVHIKINTGMNRLGFDHSELSHLAEMIKSNPLVRVQTVFSHFVASEDPAADDFTRQQLAEFERGCTLLQEATGYTFLRHIANSFAIQRHPEAQLDMVRLGMGMYGGDASGQLALEPVATLTSTIAQIRKVPPGSTIGYGRAAVVSRETIVAVINIGYADGFSRQLGNGNGEVMLAGKRAKVMGHVCMDMTMIDITDVPEARIGMEVEIFGRNISIAELARKSGTITYEIMTGISGRVKRVYIEE